MPLHQLCDFRGILIRSQPRGNLRRRFRRDHRLGAFAQIAAPDSIELQCRPNPKLLDDRVALLAGKARRAHRPAELFFFPGQGIQRFALLARHGGHIVVEPGNRNLEIPVVQLRDHLGKNGDRVRHRSAENSRVQVLRRPGHFHLVIIQAAQTVGDRGHAFGKHRRIGNDQRISLQPLLIRLHEIPQIHAADFLLAFHHHLDVHRKLAVGIAQRFERFDVDVNLAFVVRRAPAVDIAVADGRLEGRRRPQIERFGRLHVVVPVEENRRLTRGVQRFSVDERVQLCGHDLDIFQTGRAQLFSHPARRPFNIGPVFALGANAGNPQQLL